MLINPAFHAHHLREMCGAFVAQSSKMFTLIHDIIAKSVRPPIARDVVLPVLLFVRVCMYAGISCVVLRRGEMRWMISIHKYACRRAPVRMCTHRYS